VMDKMGRKQVGPQGLNVVIGDIARCNNFILYSLYA
jgi:hypothetical protein